MQQVEKFLILGARQHAKVIVSIAREWYSATHQPVGFLDDDPSLAGARVLGLPVLGRMDCMEQYCRENGIRAVAVGVSNRYMDFRAELFARAKAAGLSVPSWIHGRAYVSPDAVVGEGVVLNPGVVANAFAKVGDNVVVYSNSTIEHETVLADHDYIGPGVNFSSNARVGKGTFIGAGSRIIPDITIGANVVIGAGSVVIGDVPDNVTFAGVPARFINDRSKTKI